MYGIELEGSSFFYTKAGSGKNNIFLFHGFGQHHSIFDPLVKVLIEDDYTCYSFDLFFHGKSVWGRKSNTLDLLYWKKIIETLLERESITRFSLLGFSLGGKLALATLHCFPDFTEKIFLVAAEGLRKNFWYTLATQTSLTRNIFRHLVYHPKPFFLFLTFYSFLGAVPKTLIRFVFREMSSIEKRKTVFASWVLYRKLNFDLNSVKELCLKYRIRIIFVGGNKDQIMKPASIKKIQNVFKISEIHILDATHIGLLKALPSFIKKWNHAGSDR